MNREDAMATGYTMASLWCMRCDVGWPRTRDADETCWFCQRSDMTHRWTFTGKEPGLYKTEEAG